MAGDLTGNLSEGLTGNSSGDLTGNSSGDSTGTLTGVFSGNAKGFGFVSVEGRDGDLYIPADRTGGAMDGDRVQVQVSPGASFSGKRAEGTVVRVLERAHETLVGYYQKNKSYGFVVPDNRRLGKDIFIPQGQDAGAVTGHKVVVRITDYGKNGRSPEGEIVEILGHIHDPGVDILSLVRAYDLPEAFPEEVMEEARGVPQEVGPEEREGRRDLRDWLTVTIDGEDARDLDDAVTLTREDFGYRLGVHIADVTHYVREGSALDREALRRGTSVYLADRVIPMLPHRLSNGICSLNQGVDRLALSCIMDIDGQGRLLNHEIVETVIRVDRRMTYTAVDAALAGAEEDAEENPAEAKEDAREDSVVVASEDIGEDPVVVASEDTGEDQAFTALFCRMKELADILRQRRRSRGSIDFDFPETKLILDEAGHPLDIRPYERTAATRIIEDFMLMANETVAEDCYWQDLPFLYRTHDNPDPEKMKRLAVFINNFGYAIRFQNGEVHPKEIQKLLDRIEGSEEEALISRLTLRSMKQARYTPDCSGHFGLAARYYTHFTSPIRRYPDLQIHRIIKENLHGQLTEERADHYHHILQGVAVQSSSLERRADEAERETIKLKKCEYMEKRIGEILPGVISGVTAWGFYVELPNTVEGLVPVAELFDDFYIFEEERMELRGERTGRVYRLGQRVSVMAAGADRLNRTIDFVPA